MSDTDDGQRRRRRWAAFGALVLGTVIAVTVLFRRDEPVRYVTGRVERGDVRDTVEATGTVNAVITVQVGSQVSGTVARLDADFNSQVHKGEVIAAIDPRLFEGTLAQANADLANAGANLEAASANLEKAKVTAVQTHEELDRASALARSGIGTTQALDLARANYQSAAASVDAAKAQVAQAQAQVAQKEAAVKIARANLDYTIIRSPIDGTVVARNVDVGQTVAASLQAPTIFTIAQDLTQMQVYAKVDESDVGRIRPGQPATFKVDAFPKETFTGTVTQVRMNPTTVQNVVTYDAIVDFANPERKLFPGMTAYITLPVASAQDVLEIPNAALRFKPPIPSQAMRAAYMKSGIPVDHPARGGQAEAGPRGERADVGVVWKRRPDGQLEPVQLALGITDHTVTEVRQVLHGALAPGDEVVTGALAAKGGQPPGAPGPRR